MIRISKPEATFFCKARSRMSAPMKKVASGFDIRIIMREIQTIAEFGSTSGIGTAKTKPIGFLAQIGKPEGKFDNQIQHPDILAGTERRGRDLNLERRLLIGQEQRF